jgi:excisionase family DNA binding protein
MVKWHTLPQFMKKTGLSRKSIMKMIEEGELVYTMTDGEGRYLIKEEVNEELLELKKELDVTKGILLKLCAHMGVK